MWEGKNFIVQSFFVEDTKMREKSQARVEKNHFGEDFKMQGASNYVIEGHGHQKRLKPFEPARCLGLGGDSSDRIVGSNLVTSK